MLGTTLTVSAGTRIQAYRNDEIKILLNGELQTFRDTTTNEIELPIMYNDRTYLPLRSLATMLGLNVDYDEGIHFEYGPNRKLYGFEEDIFFGCSEWCSVGNWEYKATATSTLKSQSEISYDASNILNYERNNTWVEGVDVYEGEKYDDTALTGIVVDFWTRNH